MATHYSVSTEEEMTAHSSTLAWRIPLTEELAGYSPWGRKELDTTDWTHTHTLCEKGSLYFSFFPISLRATIQVKYNFRRYDNAPSNTVFDKEVVWKFILCML